MIHPRQVVKFVRYVGVFLKELVVANYQVVKMVVAPELRIKPGFITVPMDAKSEFEITSLANSITLTPGTISVHVPRDRNAIVIHAINIGDDPDELRNSIKQTLEAGILDWTRKDGFVAEPIDGKPAVSLNEATSPDNDDAKEAHDAGDRNEINEENKN